MSEPAKTHTVEVLDSWMAYRDEGESGIRPMVVFLHGNPTSSYLWRNVIPHVSGQTRCLAPDLIGMGESGKPEIGYRFADHARYLGAWLDAVVPDGEVVFVGHDWGGALALDWAARHGSGRVRGVALIETFLRPMAWSEMAPRAAERFRGFRTPGVGERLVLEQNMFIEGLPASTPNIAPEALDAYRAPYPDPVSRRPLLQWSREFPLDGEPADVVGRVLEYDEWLRQAADVPKLLMTVTPAQGLGSPEVIAWARANISALEVRDVGEAGHQAPEDRPDAIGQAVAQWLERLR